MTTALWLLAGSACVVLGAATTALTELVRHRHTRRDTALALARPPLCLGCGHPVATHQHATGCATVTDHLLCACERGGTGEQTRTAGVTHATPLYGFDYTRRHPSGFSHCPPRDQRWLW